MTDTDKPFQLEDDAPRHKPWRGAEHSEETQRVLFTGLDCLPGQLDLFCTDYKEDEDD
jgi:hypothetical protein